MVDIFLIMQLSINRIQQSNLCINLIHLYSYFLGGSFASILLLSFKMIVGNAISRSYFLVSFILFTPMTLSSPFSYFLLFFALYSLSSPSLLCSLLSCMSFLFILFLLLLLSFLHSHLLSPLDSLLFSNLHSPLF